MVYFLQLRPLAVATHDSDSCWSLSCRQLALAGSRPAAEARYHVDAAAVMGWWWAGSGPAHGAQLGEPDKRVGYSRLGTQHRTLICPTRPQYPEDKVPYRQYSGTKVLRTISQSSGGAPRKPDQDPRTALLILPLILNKL